MGSVPHGGAGKWTYHRLIVAEPTPGHTITKMTVYGVVFEIDTANVVVAVSVPSAWVTDRPHEVISNESHSSPHTS